MIWLMGAFVLMVCICLFVGYLIGRRIGAQRYINGVKEKVFFDTMIFGNGFMQFNRDKKGRVGVKHISAQTVRLTPPEKKVSKPKRSG